MVPKRQLDYQTPAPAPRDEPNLLRHGTFLGLLSLGLAAACTVSWLGRSLAASLPLGWLALALSLLGLVLCITGAFQRRSDTTGGNIARAVATATVILAANVLVLWRILS